MKCKESKEDSGFDLWALSKKEAMFNLETFPLFNHGVPVSFSNGGKWKIKATFKHSRSTI